MADAFDVVVIGAGPPGENAAGRAAEGGLSVAIVEERLVGGECSYYGCIPSKTLIRPGDAIAAAKRVPGAAEAVTGTIDAAKAFAQRDYMTSDWNDSSSLPWLESEGIELVRGHGRLAGDRTVSVDLKEGGTRTLSASKAVVISCGSTALMPPIDGLGDARPWDNVIATSTKEVPRRLLVLGGGPIGVELAQCFKRLGADEVSVFEGGARLLAREEPFAGKEVQEAFEKEGITVVIGTKVTSVRREGSDGPVVATLEDGRTFNGDEILVAVGRRPRTDDVGLDSVGLEQLAGKYLDVDDRIRVKGGPEWLYAVGDCNGKALLTHMGKYQGRLAGDIIAGKDARDLVEPDAIPRVTFTDPQVAAVGLTEEQAKEKGLNVRAVTYAMPSVSGVYVRGNDMVGTGQMVVDESNRTIVGATFTGQDVQELVQAATVAIVGKLTLDQLWHAVPVFPTVSEIWLRLLETYGL